MKHLVIGVVLSIFLKQALALNCYQCDRGNCLSTLSTLTCKEFNWKHPPLCGIIRCAPGYDTTITANCYYFNLNETVVTCKDGPLYASGDGVCLPLTLHPGCRMCLCDSDNCNDINNMQCPPCPQSTTTTISTSTSIGTNTSTSMEDMPVPLPPLMNTTSHQGHLHGETSGSTTSELALMAVTAVAIVSMIHMQTQNKQH